MSQKSERDGWFKLSVRLIIAVIGLMGGLIGLLLKAADWIPVQLTPVVTIVYIDPTRESSLPTLDIDREILPILQGAASAEIAALQTGDSSYYNDFFIGQALQERQSVIADMNNRGLVVQANYDVNRSAWRINQWISSTSLTVQSCEYWQSTAYDRATGQTKEVLQMQGIPQMYTFELKGGRWFISQLDFNLPTSICIS